MFPSSSSRVQLDRRRRSNISCLLLLVHLQVADRLAHHEAATLLYLYRGLEMKVLDSFQERNPAY